MKIFDNLLDFVFNRDDSVEQYRAYLKCQREITEAQDRNTLYFEQRRLEREKRRREIEQCEYLSQKCSCIMFMFGRDIPKEDFNFFFLYEGHSAFLPLSIKPFLTQDRS